MAGLHIEVGMCVIINNSFKRSFLVVEYSNYFLNFLKNLNGRPQAHIINTLKGFLGAEEAETLDLLMFLVQAFVLPFCNI